MQREGIDQIPALSKDEIMRPQKQALLSAFVLSIVLALPGALAEENSGEPDLNPYMQEVQATMAGYLSQAKTPPHSGKLVSIIEFSIESASGRIKNAKINSSSGNGELDKVALEIVEHAKLKPLPAGAPAEVTIQFNFDFSRKGSNEYKKDLARLSQPGSDPKELVNTLLLLAKSLEDEKKESEALSYTQRAVTEAEKLWGPLAPETMNSRRELIICNLKAKKHSNSAELLQKQIKILESQKNDDRDLAQTYAALGHCQAAISKHNEAETSFKKAIASYAKCDSIDRNTLNGWIDELQACLDKQNKQVAAASLIEAELSSIERKELSKKTADLAASEKTKPQSDPALAQEQTELANSLYFKNKSAASANKDDLAQAEALYRKALASCKKYGFQKPQTDSIMLRLADCLMDEKNYKEAAVYYDEALKLRLARYGKNHKAVQQHAAQLAGLYEALGNKERAIELYKEALASSSNTAGADIGPGQSKEMIASSLAALYLASGKASDAARLMSSLVPGEMKPLNWQKLQSLKAAAYYLLKAGKAEEAERLLQEIASKFSSSQNDCSDRAYILLQLAELYISRKNYSAALETLKEASELHQKAKEVDASVFALLAMAAIKSLAGDKDAELEQLKSSLEYARKSKSKLAIQISLAKIADYYWKKESYSQAAPYIAEEYALSTGAEKTGEAVRLAWFHYGEEQSDRAERLLKQSLAEFESKKTDSQDWQRDYNYSMVCSNLGDFCNLNNRVQEAEAYYKKAYELNPNTCPPRLSMFYLRHGRYKDAEKLGLREKYQSLDAYCKLKENKLNEAEQAYRKTLKSLETSVIPVPFIEKEIMEEGGELQGATNGIIGPQGNFPQVPVLESLDRKPLLAHCQISPNWESPTKDWRSYTIPLVGLEEDFESQDLSRLTRVFFEEGFFNIDAAKACAKARLAEVLKAEDKNDEAILLMNQVRNAAKENQSVKEALKHFGLAQGDKKVEN